MSAATQSALETASLPVLQKAFSTPDNQILTVSCHSLRKASPQAHAILPQFGITPNSRNSNKMDRMEMIHKLADQVVSVNPAHKVDLKDPQRTILIEVHKVGDHNS